MRGAFVIRLAPETEPGQGRFEGWVEEVDSGAELRFRSAEELLQFLANCFDATIVSGSSPDELIPPSEVE